MSIPTRGRWGARWDSLIVGNGTSDDSQALMRCITRLPEGSTLDLTGKTLRLLRQVTLNRRVNLHGGTVVTTGRRALLITAADVTLDGVTVTRTGTDNADNGSAVTVNATGVTLDGCTITSTAGSGLHVQNGNCTGLRVLDGSYSTSVQSNANGSAIFVQEGGIQNADITIDGPTIRNTGYGHGIAMFAASDCVVSNCDIAHIRRHPLVEVTDEWVDMTGGVWRIPNADVRSDGVEPNSVWVNGVEIDFDYAHPTTTTPAPNRYSHRAGDGFMYINLDGDDPNDQTIETTRSSGYGIVLYATATTPVSMDDNTISHNTITDTDNMGIYLQVLQLDPHRNAIVHNTLADTCLEGVTLRQVPQGAIGVFGGRDTVIADNTINGAGSEGKSVRGGIAFKRGEDTLDCTATLTSNIVTNVHGPGVALNPGTYVIDDCTITDCTGDGVVTVNPQNDSHITLTITDSTIDNVTLNPGSSTQTYTLSASGSELGVVTVPP